MTEIKINNEGLTSEEIRALEEPLPSVTPPRTNASDHNRGRKRSGKYVEFEDAKEFVQGELIQSRKAYEEWWTRHKPKDIPRFPHRIYSTVWKGWNDYLGNQNTFGIHNSRNWRPYAEAVKYVHTLQLSSYANWIAFCKRGEVPDDIPTRPDLVYSKWRTWNHWLGNKRIEALEAQREADKQSQVYYIIHEPGMPENILTFGIDPAGAASFKNRWDREKFNIVRAFWYDRDESAYINNVVQSLSTSYMGDEYQRVVPNFWEIIYYLEQKLDRVNMQKTYEISKEVIERQENKRKISIPTPELNNAQYDNDDMSEDEYEERPTGYDDFGIMRS